MKSPPAKPVPGSGSWLARSALTGLGPISAGYLALVAVLVIAADVSGQPWLYGSAVLITLPCGFPALIGIYGFYGLWSTAGSLLGASTASTDGSVAQWLSVPTDIADVVLLVGAAIGNIALIRLAKRRRG